MLAILLCGVFGYTVFQARHLITGPQIVLEETYEVVQTERLVTLEGQTKNITSLSLNGPSFEN